MRVSKDAEERKNEILDTAEALFAQKGFDNTSTADILNAVGIARGTLYYHFKSKEDILDAAISRMVEQKIRSAAMVICNKELPFLSRLPMMFLALNDPSKISEEMLEQMHRPQNALMHQKTQEKLLAGIVPILDEWVREGIEQGLFHTEYGAEAVEMLMLYGTEMFDDLNEVSAEQKERRVMGFIYNTERMLGCESGALKEALLGILRYELEKN